jgi:hypothetical protein
MTLGLRSELIRLLTLTISLYPGALGLNLSAFEINPDGYLEPDTHYALSVIAARDHGGSLVQDFLEYQLLESHGLMTLGLVDTNPFLQRPNGRVAISYLEALGRGATDEDSGHLGPNDRPGDLYYSHADEGLRHRMAYHFYDPSHHGQGLNDTTGIIEWLRGEGFLSLGPIPQTSSLNWAWSNPNAAPMPRNPVAEDFSWQHARRQYYFWLTAPDPSLRAWRAGETFYGLGHVIHLVQDLAQPQHTRNDGHQPAALGGHGAPLEEYCLKHYGTVNQIKALPHASLPVFMHLPKDQHDGIPPEFRAFWNTDQIFGDPPNNIPARQPSGISDINSLGLAEFSNAYFVSDDTLFTGEPPSQLWPYGSSRFEILAPRVELRHQFQYPRLDDLFNKTDGIPKVRYLVYLERYGESSDPFRTFDIQLGRRSPWIPEFCSANADATMALALTDKNRESHAKVLLPKAIAYSTGLLNYFFRGRLKMEFLYPEEGTPNPQLKLKITNVTTNEAIRSGEALGNGFFTLLREDPATTNRSVVMSLPVYGNYPGLSTSNLPFGRSFTNNLPGNILRDGKFILVFQGTIGNEKDIGVAAVASPGLCDQFEVLANGGNNTVVQAGDLITFTRRRINSDSTAANVPITESSWIGTPYIGGYNLWDGEFTLAGITDGALIAGRQGRFTLTPNGGGCVTIQVKDYLVSVVSSWGILYPCAYDLSITGSSMGQKVTEHGNALGARVSELLSGQPAGPYNDTSCFRFSGKPGFYELGIYGTGEIMNVGLAGGLFFFYGFDAFGDPWYYGTGISAQNNTIGLAIPPAPGDE